ncbi:hypothetical protein EVAR_30592_1 [Eumeta japonica]|uniref:Uncharacterized protein n=1 Tax=Eumeta variegata TaxID=151549 RepID=A0A4C1WBH4_EUMVA|nr:hypothetical protein EVAR_30592_1 [Eumeta japonica]
MPLTRQCPGPSHRLMPAPASLTGYRRPRDERDSYVKYAKCMATSPRMQCMQLTYGGGCAIYKLQRNWCIRHSCTPTATCKSRAAINKPEY